MVELEVRPPLPQAEHEALMRQLASHGARLDGRPPAYESAWRQVGHAEAVDGEGEPELYARSPRSTLGATRA